MADSYSTTATLTNEKTVVLDEALPISGRIRVTIEALPDSKKTASFLVKLQAIHQALADSGYQSRSREAIDSQMNDERENWDD